MTPNEVETILKEIRRACHGFAGWAAAEIELLAAQNRTSLDEERRAMHEQWDRVLAATDFSSGRIVVRRLEAGRIGWPPFGQLLAFVRCESQTESVARRRSEAQQLRIAERNARLAAAAQAPASLTGQAIGVEEQLAEMGLHDLLEEFRRARQKRATQVAKDLQPKTPRGYAKFARVDPERIRKFLLAQIAEDARHNQEAPPSP
jgi:hypothetical protein